MRGWLRKNGPAILLNGLALAIMLTLLSNYLRLRSGSPASTDTLFEESGKWAIRCLLICLTMTPLNTVFGWRWAVRLRKPAGLWAFAFAALHFLTYTKFEPLNLNWLRNNPVVYIWMGLAALVILLLLAVTSNQRAMRWLGKSWKRLHRLVYIAAPLTIGHAIIAFTSGKKIFRDGDAFVHELQLYLAVLVVLLALRLPFVRQLIQRVKYRRNAPTAVPLEPILVHRDRRTILIEQPPSPEIERDRIEEPMLMP